MHSDKGEEEGSDGFRPLHHSTPESELIRFGAYEDSSRCHRHGPRAQHGDRFYADYGRLPRVLIL